jgi:FKBP-type peptidyl-prolyl cis-trans isomerase FklB
MKLMWMAGLALGLCAMQASAQDAAPQTDKDKLSYAIGVQVAKGIQAQGIDVDAEGVAKGVRDALAGATLLLTEQQIETAMMGLQEEMQRKQEQARAAMLEKNKKEGDAFLAENAKKEGVVSLPSGLQYKILTATEGAKPTETDTVVCHYRGTLINGTEFDSSYKTQEPATFAINAVIPGFQEAIRLMTVGSKWQFFIPSNLAYGERGAGNVIQPNSTLIFEIELISIQAKL